MMMAHQASKVNVVTTKAPTCGTTTGGSQLGCKLDNAACVNVCKLNQRRSLPLQSLLRALTSGLQVIGSGQAGKLGYANFHVSFTMSR